MRTEAWWVCNNCGTQLIRVGRGGHHDAFRAHRAATNCTGGGRIEQRPQARSRPA